MPASRVLYARHLDALAALVASSAFFQELCGAANATEALEHVHYPFGLDGREDIEDADSDKLAPMPRAIINVIPRYTLEDRGVAAWHDSGAALLSFEFEPTAAYVVTPDTVTASRARTDEHLNRVFTIIDEMIGNNGGDRPAPATTTYVRMLKIDLQEIGELVDEDERGLSIMAAVFLIEW